MLLAGLIISLHFTERPPSITKLEPEIGLPGAVLVIEGRDFGDTKGSSEVTLAGVRPTSSSYLEWHDDRISVQIPEEVGTGPIKVVTRYGASNGVLFTNRNLIPVVVSKTAEPGYPYIESISPTKATVGSIVTLSGLNFGLSRGDGSVLFTALPTATDRDGGEALPASRSDFDYESWSEQTVRVRVPDGASSGTIRIVTDRGESNALFFEVTRVGGSKSLPERRGFQIAYSVIVDQVFAEPDASIDLWAPIPVATPAQRNIESVMSPDPMWDDYFGLTRFHLAELDPDTVYRVDLMSWLDRYALETRIEPSRVNWTYDTDRRLYRVYTAPDPAVPSDDVGIIEAARSAAGRERNPYLIARNAYRFLLTQMTYDQKSSAKNVIDAFISASGDSSDYSLLLCAMLRSLGIPARPVTGVLVTDARRTTNHMWAEFYLEGYGWVPVDPLLGDGVELGEAFERSAPEEYYFGNIDERRIVFTRGLIDLTSATGEASDASSADTVSTVPSLQSYHETVSRGVESYRSSWESVEIVDFW